MNFTEENDLKKLWNEEPLLDSWYIVRNLFERFARIINSKEDVTGPSNDVLWVLQQLHGKGVITEDWCIEGDFITDVFINNTKVIWFPESIQNPNFGKLSVLSIYLF